MNATDPRFIFNPYRIKALTSPAPGVLWGHPQSWGKFIPSFLCVWTSKLQTMPAAELLPQKTCQSSSPFSPEQDRRRGPRNSAQPELEAKLYWSPHRLTTGFRVHRLFVTHIHTPTILVKLKQGETDPWNMTTSPCHLRDWCMHPHVNEYANHLGNCNETRTQSLPSSGL